jgi:hypothetical protein
MMMVYSSVIRLNRLVPSIPGITPPTPGPSGSGATIKVYQIPEPSKIPALSLPPMHVLVSIVLKGG